METLLPAIWCILWGLLWAIYFGIEGFSMGSGMLTAIYNDPEEQRLAINSIGPIWDGNGVWLITAGGVTFAAFPKLYAVMFSSLYLPLMLVLFSLVLRAVSIEFYNFKDDPGWKRNWAWVLSITSLLIALLFGVAFGNIFQGVQMDANGYHGNLFTLLNPYGLTTGILFIVAALYNGAAWLSHKTPLGSFGKKAYDLAQRLWPILFGIAALWLVYTAVWTPLLGNYLKVPLLFAIPLLAVVLLVLSKVYLGKKRPGLAVLMGSLTVLVTVMAAIVGMFPNMLPSAIDTATNLTAYNASSSTYTLKIMLIAALIFLPIVLVYQTYAYTLFARPKTEETSDLY